ncbi:MAG: DUF1572 family protein [Chitinophagaceae bacterium]
MSHTIETIFLESVIKQLRDHKGLADKTFSQLEEADFHFQPGTESNSIAIIIQHMSGNMLSRWTNFLTEDGEKPWRERDTEFGVHPLTRQQLIEKWQKGWECLFNALQQLTGDDLGKTIYIRTEPHSVVDAINRQLAHYPYNVGQIVYLGKMIKNENWKNLSVKKGLSADYNVMKKNERVSP